MNQFQNILSFFIDYMQMAIVKRRLQELKAFELKGKFGKPSEFGEIYFGVSLFGDANSMNGVYQIRHCKVGRRVVRMKYAAPPIESSLAIIASRITFSNAMANWALQSTPAKNWWRLKAKPLQMHGSNLFVKQYMQTH